jgi:hypothetical protein
MKEGDGRLVPQGGGVSFACAFVNQSCLQLHCHQRECSAFPCKRTNAVLHDAVLKAVRTVPPARSLARGLGTLAPSRQSASVAVP